MPDGREQPPQYTRYRARRRLLPGREEELPSARGASLARDGGDRRALRPRGGAPLGWRRWATRKRILLGLLGLVLGWLGLALVLFLISSHFERTSPPARSEERRVGKESSSGR